MTKPEVSRWIAEQRKRQGWKSGELALRMVAAGYEVAETTIRTWEAGRRPSADNLAALERLFGVPAPAETQGGDTSALAAAIHELAAEVRLSRAEEAVTREVLMKALGAVLAQRGMPAEDGHDTPVGVGR